MMNTNTTVRFCDVCDIMWRVLFFFSFEREKIEVYKLPQATQIVIIN